MTEFDLEFFEYFAQAQIEVLTDRERKIVEFKIWTHRKQTSNSSFHSIGNIFGISRERIRQLWNRAYRKIRVRGQKQIKASMLDAPCAELLNIYRVNYSPPRVKFCG